MRIPLPTDYTVFRFLIPSMGIEKKFRPFTVKENKALLAAQSTDEETVMLDTLIQIINNCCVDNEPIDAAALALFDIEYLLIKLRGISIGEESTLLIECSDPHDGFTESTRQNEVVMSLDNIEVQGLDQYSTKIRLSNDMVVNMKVPTIELAKKLKSVELDASLDVMLDVVTHNISVLIDNICTVDEVIEASSCTVNDIREWLESLTDEQFLKLYRYFSSIPKCRIKIEWTCPHCGKRNLHYVEGMSYFFS